MGMVFMKTKKKIGNTLENSKMINFKVKANFELQNKNSIIKEDSKMVYLKEMAFLNLME